MSITEIGREGEKLARLILKSLGCEDIFQADWIVKKQGKWYVVEVKRKERFMPPPFEGHGLDIRQVNARLRFYQDTNVRCLFIVFDLTDGNTYWQWLDVLDKGEHYDTKRKVRIYPLTRLIRLIVNFNKADLTVLKSSGCLNQSERIRAL